MPTVHQDQIVITQNPVNDFIEVVIDDDQFASVYDFYLHDMSGKLFLHKKLRPGKNKIDVPQLFGSYVYLATSVRNRNNKHESYSGILIIK